VRTIELTFDDGLDRAVRDLWDRLALAGVASLAGHTHPTNRPHVTLATTDGLPGGLGPLFAGLPLAVELGAPLWLGSGRRVLALAVTPDAELAALQARVWEELAPAGGRNPLHEPGRWVPHVSLTRRLGPGAAADAGALVDAMGAGPGELRGWATAARSYDSETRTTEPLG
jgi:hypothetical protein